MHGPQPALPFERGRHADLVTRDGPYASMWNKQKQAAEALEILKAVENDPDVMHVATV